MAIQTGDDLFTEAKWIVDPNPGAGTHTTIAGALTSASAGDTIFIRPGTYTENPTLKVGVNLTAWETDNSLNGTGTVIISGNCTLSTAGSVTISGIQLQTNSAALLTVSGSVASVVNLNNCFLNCTNTTGISYSSSSASSAINLKNCNGDTGTTGIAIFSMSSAGSLFFIDCDFTNSGNTTTANTSSAGATSIRRCGFTNPITTSGTAAFSTANMQIFTSPQNATSLTCGGSGAHLCIISYFASGTASAVSISNTTAIFEAVVVSSNTNAITGAGTINYSGISFGGTSTTINTTTQTASGTLQGSKNTAPAAGFLGEQLRATASAVSISNATPKTITSVNLTPGIWDISGLGQIDFSTNAGTVCQIGISTTTNNFTGSEGDAFVFLSSTAILAGALNASIPSFRVTISASTTYFLVMQGNFGAGTATATARISATRVG